MSLYIKQDGILEQFSNLIVGGNQSKFKIGGDIYGNSITTIS